MRHRTASRVAPALLWRIPRLVLSSCRPKSNLYLNDLIWDIYDRLATFTQMGAYSMSSAERGVALTQGESPVVNASVACVALPKVRGNSCGGWHAVTLRAYLLRAVLQVLGRLHRSPPCPQPLREALRLAHCSDSRCTLQPYVERKAGKYFHWQVYGFVA
jgi:hypothetical protein